MVRFAFWILSSTVSTIIHTFLSILSLRNHSKVFAFSKISLAVKLLSGLSTVKSWSSVTSLTAALFFVPLTALPILMPRSKSSRRLISLLFDCLFLRVKNSFCSNRSIVIEMIILTANQQHNGNKKKC